MIDDIDLFNHLYFQENPLSVFADPDSPYHDYHLKVTETNSFYDSMIRVSANKIQKWSMSTDQALGNLLMAYYVGFFELFAFDGLISTFYSTFPRYCEEVLLDNPGYVFKDILGDTVFHYASYSFDCGEYLSELYNLVKENNPKVYDPLLMKNLIGLTPADILLE